MNNLVPYCKVVVRFVISEITKQYTVKFADLGNADKAANLNCTRLKVNPFQYFKTTPHIPSPKVYSCLQKKLSGC